MSRPTGCFRSLLLATDCRRQFQRLANRIDSCFLEAELARRKGGSRKPVVASEESHSESDSDKLAVIVTDRITLLDSNRSFRQIMQFLKPGREK